jgi:septum site-determining protein MinD
MITAGKGGVGKSTSAAVLGYSLAKLGKKVLLIEFDMGLRSLDIMLGVENKAVYDISDIVEGICTAKDAIVQSDYCENLNLLVASADSDFSIDISDFALVLKSVYDDFDHIFIDTPAGLGPLVKLGCDVCDNALIVTTPDPVCVRDGGKCVDTIRRWGVAEIRLIINRAEEKPTKNSPIRDYDDVIDTVGARLIGVVPEDKNVVRSLFKGEPVKSDLDFTKAYMNIAKRFLGNDISLLIK